MNKVSVIVPTYNRFKYLINTIKSIKEQTYKNLEIIVINDGSSQKEYYEYDWKKDEIIILHLKENTKKLFGYGCVGYVRNKGIELATGKYIAFCDDDDIWFPQKIELQIKALNESNCKMCCTEGIIGEGMFDKSKNYKKFNSEFYYNDIQNIYKLNGYIFNDFPKLFYFKFIKIHNCIICSSVLIEKELLNKINRMPHKRRSQDYYCWLKALRHTNCVYVNEVCFYYDINHGDGGNH
jgi:teichuronic acid biosynthesis glycosyltransferase TuaG